MALVGLEFQIWTSFLQVLPNFWQNWLSIFFTAMKASECEVHEDDDDRYKDD